MLDWASRRAISVYGFRFAVSARPVWRGVRLGNTDFIVELLILDGIASINRVLVSNNGQPEDYYGRANLGGKSVKVKLNSTHHEEAYFTRTES